MGMFIIGMIQAGWLLLLKTGKYCTLIEWHNGDDINANDLRNLTLGY